MAFANKFASALHTGDIYDNGSKFGPITAIRKNEARSAEDDTLYVFGHFYCQVKRGRCAEIGGHYHHFGIPADSLVLVRR
ncbi:hypothetical protein Pan2_83 [Pseudanabaena phage Pan2]|nr:hypothetical protein Pan2_83 [Pseudanabaena phage Pan2]